MPCPAYSALLGNPADGLRMVRQTYIVCYNFVPNNKLPNYLRGIRKSVGFSQKEVAYLLGAHTGGSISRYERFNRVPTLMTALKMEIILGAPVRDLFAGLHVTASGVIARRAHQLLKRGLSEKANDGWTARDERLRIIAGKEGLNHNQLSRP